MGHSILSEPQFPLEVIGPPWVVVQSTSDVREIEWVLNTAGSSADLSGPTHLLCEAFLYPPFPHLRINFFLSSHPGCLIPT